MSVVDELSRCLWSKSDLHFAIGSVDVTAISNNIISYCFLSPSERPGDFLRSRQLEPWSSAVDVHLLSVSLQHSGLVRRGFAL